MTRTVLFLCTGNYYRSRYAEALFNALAIERGLDWCADSRGIATELLGDYIGTIADCVVQRLEQQHLPTAARNRLPLQLGGEDLEVADLIIALYESEHRPLLERRFPGWADRVTYWHVPDLNLLPSEAALAAIEDEVRRLVLRLSQPELENRL
jgi:protein-tyrosine-phosphatase